MSTFGFVEAGFTGTRDKEDWEKIWISCKQPWRTEPEISNERQYELDKLRKIEPDIKQGIYPFKDIHLNRADVEWLLSTHHNHHGPVNWNDESQREREGLDLRGADLSNEDLSRLPLAKLQCSLNIDEIIAFSEKNLSIEDYRIKTQLQGVNLSNAQLQHADLDNAQLQDANLFDAQLQGANLTFAQLQEANLDGAKLQEADFDRAQLLKATLVEAQLQGAFLNESNLQGADLSYAQLQGANLINAQLQRAILCEAQLQGTKIKDVELADIFHNGPQLADVQWGDTNLAVVDWSKVKRLGDECEAIQEVDSDDGQDKSSFWRFHDYQTATRAYRQLSVALRNQGINEHAARFTYRAQLMQRKLFFQRGHDLKWLGSLFLDLLSGYGYKPLRCFIAYLIVILTFATAYFIIGHKVGPVLSPLGSVVFSMTSFHGRGFFPGGIALDDLLTVVAALEAFIGLLIEVTFIATLTQRLFGR